MFLAIWRILQQFWWNFPSLLCKQWPKILLVHFDALNLEMLSKFKCLRSFFKIWPRTIVTHAFDVAPFSHPLSVIAQFVRKKRRIWKIFGCLKLRISVFDLKKNHIKFKQKVQFTFGAPQALKLSKTFQMKHNFATVKILKFSTFLADFLSSSFKSRFQHVIPPWRAVDFASFFPFWFSNSHSITYIASQSRTTSGSKSRQS